MLSSRAIFALVLAGTLAACGGGSATGPDTGGTPGMGGMPGGGGSGSNGVSDADVYGFATAITGWVYYKHSKDTLDSAPSSPHTGRIRTRYNGVAQAELDSLGKVMPNAVFPNGSMIAKEVYQSGKLSMLAVMYKQTGDPHAGDGGWIWAEYDPNGRVIHSVTLDPKVCEDCHSIGIDHTRMNDAHP